MARLIVVVDADASTRAVVADVARRQSSALVATEASAGLPDCLRGEAPALVVVELGDDGGGLELMAELLARFGPQLPVVLVSEVRTDPFDRVAGFLLGADDYVIKPFDAGELRARLLRSFRRRHPGAAHACSPAILSERELEVLARLAAGRSQAEISRDLFISPKTVGTHIQHLLVKLDVHSRAQAVAAAYRLGLVRSADIDGEEASGGQPSLVHRLGQRDEIRTAHRRS